MSLSRCCDICNKKIERYDHSFQIRLRLDDLDDENDLGWITKDLCSDCNSRMNVYLKTKPNINNNKVESDNRSGLKKWLGKIFK